MVQEGGKMLAATLLPVQLIYKVEWHQELQAVIVLMPHTGEGVAVLAAQDTVIFLRE